MLNKNFRKKIIIIDRFIDSTIAYQHYGLGINLKLINLINKYLLKNFKVDFTFLNTVNKKNMNKAIDLFIKNLIWFKKDIKYKKNQSILKKLIQTKKVRSKIIKLKQDIDRPDFGRN